MRPLTLLTLTAPLAIVKGCHVPMSPDAAPSRRDRLRAATKAEIVETARKLLVADGLTGVTLRAIGRDMGMTAPALYRYYASWTRCWKACARRCSTTAPRSSRAASP